jgi:hypothetical protein
MRFLETLPTELAVAVGEMTGVKLTSSWMRLRHQPTSPRVSATVARLRDFICASTRFRPVRIPEDFRSVPLVAEALIELASAAPPSECLSGVLSRGREHFTSCPICARHLAALFAATVADLRTVDLPPRHKLVRSYRRAYEAMLPFIEIDCGAGATVPVFAETMEEEEAVLEAARDLWRIPRLLRGLNVELLRVRAECDGQLASKLFRETVRDFVREQTVLRFVPRISVA